MNRDALIRRITSQGCILYRHGARHDIYINLLPDRSSLSQDIQRSMIPRQAYSGISRVRSALRVIGEKARQPIFGSGAAFLHMLFSRVWPCSLSPTSALTYSERY